MPSVPTRLLAFAGSLRRESFNRKALNHAVNGAREAGAEVNMIDLADYPLPLFDQDQESVSGVPENAVALKRLFIENAGLLLACPEYNSSITPLLKNTLDWVSRPWQSQSGSVPYRNKIAGLVAASASSLGGIRGLRHVREILTTLGVIVIPRQQVVSNADRVLSAPQDHPHVIQGLGDVGRLLADAVGRWNK
ncbi:MAG TPA: NAD(P)H-dependent oxidoreductase [Thiobacillaceae bacterium]|nr:NAD(P)H-dependent oxidoreductase [Thiobacillaceae bacterium]